MVDLYCSPGGSISSHGLRVPWILNVSASRHALYGAPEIYDIAFSWNPIIESEFYGDLLRNIGRRGETSRNRIVEFGCGTGRILRMLSKLGFSCVGVDISPRMSHYAYRRGPANLVDVVVADMARVPARTETFAAAISTLSSISYLSKTGARSHLKEVNRVLIRGGVYIIDFLLGTPDRKEERWEITKKGIHYNIRWSIRPVNRSSRKFRENIDIRSGTASILRSRSTTTTLQRAEFHAAVREAGLHVKHWFKPFVPKPLPDPLGRGRIIAVLGK